MTFFGNILASSYKYYSKQKRIDAFFQAKLIVVITQTLFLILFLLIISEYFKIGIFFFINKNKILSIFLYAIMFLLDFKYYTKQRMLLTIENFEKKSKGERRFWAVITGIIPFIPLVSFFIILRLRHPI